MDHPILTKRVIQVFAEDRWSDVRGRVRAANPTHCVVREKKDREFVGVVRVKEMVAKPSERIFADLISPLAKIRIENERGSKEVMSRFRRREIEDAILLDRAGRFLGLITRESLNAWRLRDASRKRTLKSDADALREALVQIDELSYAVSHDLRTPLRAIRGYALALETDCGAELGSIGKGYVERILRASDRLERLTLGVLAYSEIARHPLAISRLDLDRVVETAGSSLGARAALADISIAPKLGYARADKKLLVECVAELFENAVKFALAGRPLKIAVRSEKTTTGCRLWIEDNGPGIQPRHRRRIFQLFEQVSLDAPNLGDGVGLAKVRRAVERMGGTVGVESAKNGGSCFWLELPAE